jgi:hypothetical protein
MSRCFVVAVCINLIAHLGFATAADAEVNPKAACGLNDKHCNALDDAMHLMQVQKSVRSGSIRTPPAGTASMTASEPEGLIPAQSSLIPEQSRLIPGTTGQQELVSKGSTRAHEAKAASSTASEPKKGAAGVGAAPPRPRHGSSSKTELLSESSVQIPAMNVGPPMSPVVPPVVIPPTMWYNYPSWVPEPQAAAVISEPVVQGGNDPWTPSVMGTTMMPAAAPVVPLTTDFSPQVVDSSKPYETPSPASPALPMVAPPVVNINGAFPLPR